MGLTGMYLARRVEHEILPYLNAFGEFVLNDFIKTFSTLEERARAVEQQAYDRFAANANEYSDPGRIAEDAHGDGVAFYLMMYRLRQGTVNLFTAGLFHYLEQALTNLACDATILDPPEDSKMAILSKWYLDNWKIHFPSLKGWQAIKEIRLVANTVKHAEGSSAQELRICRPDLFCPPILRESDPTPIFPSRVSMPLAGDDIYVTNEIFRGFHTGATEFVEALIAHFRNNAMNEFPG